MRCRLLQDLAGAPQLVELLQALSLLGRQTRALALVTLGLRLPNITPVTLMVETVRAWGWD